MWRERSDWFPVQTPKPTKYVTKTSTLGAPAWLNLLLSRITAHQFFPQIIDMKSQAVSNRLYIDSKQRLIPVLCIQIPEIYGRTDSKSLLLKVAQGQEGRARSYRRHEIISQLIWHFGSFVSQSWRIRDAFQRCHVQLWLDLSGCYLWPGTPKKRQYKDRI